MRRQLADAARGAATPKQARKRMDAVLRDWAKSDALADALFVPAVLADLAGQLMVHEHEAPGVVAPPMTESDEASPRQFALGDSQPLEAFLNLPWDEALDYFRGRGIVDEGELSTLIEGHAEATEGARKALLEHVQERVHAMLDDAIAKDQTFADFADALASEADGLGITNQDTGYLRTVFRTNVLGAYGGGRHTAMEAVAEARPIRRIWTAGDGRVGEDHVPLHGLAFRADGPLKNLRPPFRHGCRCVIVSEGPDYSGPVVTSLPPGAVAPGFGGR